MGGGVVGSTHDRQFHTTKLSLSKYAGVRPAEQFGGFQSSRAHRQAILTHAPAKEALASSRNLLSLLTAAAASRSVANRKWPFPITGSAHLVRFTAGAFIAARLHDGELRRLIAQLGGGNIYFYLRAPPGSSRNTITPRTPLFNRGPSIFISGPPLSGRGHPCVRACAIISCSRLSGLIRLPFMGVNRYLKSFPLQ